MNSARFTIGTCPPVRLSTASSSYRMAWRSMRGDARTRVWRSRPRFRPLFGTAPKPEIKPQAPGRPPLEAARYPIGLGWHHVLHARSSIERNKPWRAEYWISGIRDETLALACLRLGEETAHGRGIDRLPAAVTDPLTETLVRSLDEPELRRALAAATACFISELEALGFRAVRTTQAATSRVRRSVKPVIREIVDC